MFIMGKQNKYLKGLLGHNAFYTIILFAISFFIIFLFINFIVLGGVEEVAYNIEQNTKNIANIVKPKPTPFLFEEITIPYLRERTYSSILGELDIYSENSKYTSYVASYDSDGFSINGLLTKPNGNIPEGGWPGIVFIHGYIPPPNYVTTQNYLSYVDYLAKNGFVVFKIDLRGHGSSGGEASGAYYSGDYVIDTLNAVSALQNSGFVNFGKVGLWGHSMAGNIVFRSMIVSPEVEDIVIWSGAGYTYTDLQDYSIEDTSYRPPNTNSQVAKKRALLRETYGSFQENHWFWDQVPGTNYLDGVSGNLEIHHAENDNVVKIDYSKNLLNILEDSEISANLFSYDTGGHNLTGTSFTMAMDRTVNFFQKNLN